MANEFMKGLERSLGMLASSALGTVLSATLEAVLPQGVYYNPTTQYKLNVLGLGSGVAIDAITPIIDSKYDIYLMSLGNGMVVQSTTEPIRRTLYPKAYGE